jgi:hypothetical protein
VQIYTSDLLVATRKWEILGLKYRHNDDNGALLQQASIIMVKSKMFIGRAYSSTGGKRYAYTVLEGEPEVKRPLGRSKHNGRIVLKWGRKYILWESVELIVCLRIGINYVLLCTR